MHTESLGLVEAGSVEEVAPSVVDLQPGSRSLKKIFSQLITVYVRLCS